MSLSMWKEGKTIEQIAAERSLAISTITGHIADTADLNDESVMRSFMDKDTERKLRDFYDTHPSVPRDFAERLDEIEKNTGIRPIPIQVKIIEKFYPELIRVAKEDSEDNIAAKS